MSPLNELLARHQRYLTRRHFLRDCTLGLGGVALGTMMGCEPAIPDTQERDMSRPLMVRAAHFAPKAKRVIFFAYGRGSVPTRTVRLQTGAP